MSAVICVPLRYICISLSNPFELIAAEVTCRKVEHIERAVGVRPDEGGSADKIREVGARGIKKAFHFDCERPFQCDELANCFPSSTLQGVHWAEAWGYVHVSFMLSTISFRTFGAKAFKVSKVIR